MKQLYNFIQEKLILNKTIKSNNNSMITNITYIIMKYLNIDESNQEIFNYIKDWVGENNICTKDKIIKELEPCADPETLNESNLPIDIKKLFNDSLYLNEKCQYELDKCECLLYDTKEGFDIYASNKMICNVCSCGTLYVIIKEEFK